MRDGRPEWALATGSAALVASVYLSRVAHPNYLIAAAVCLPLAVLARRRGADIALAPLLLLAVAVEVVENGLLPPTWEQVAAAGLTERRPGLVAALCPRAGPALTRDPLGLLLGRPLPAWACCTCRSPPGASRRVRLAADRAAFALLVVAPTLLLAGVSAGTGTCAPRIRPWCRRPPTPTARSRPAVPTRSSPSPLRAGAKLVSASFRLDPPAEIVSRKRPLLPPGLSLLARSLEASASATRAP